MRHRHFTLVIIFSLIASGSLAFSQAGGRGRIKGDIHDGEGNPIDGAVITAIRADGKSLYELKTTSDKHGRWALLGFRTTHYKFNFTKEGYQSQVTVQGIQQMAKNPFMDVVLPKLSVQEVVAMGGPSPLDEANEFFDQKQYPEAVAAYQAILAEEPTYYQLNYSIGLAYQQMGEPDNAIASFEKMLVEEPLHTKALLSIGDIMVQRGDLETAVSFFEKAIDQSEDEKVAFNVAEFYITRDVAKAIEYYEKAAERKPDWPEPQLKIGYALLNSGDKEAAIAQFQKVIEVAPGSPQAEQAKAALSFLEE